MLVSFTEWRPDVAALNSRYASDVNNVLCSQGLHIPFPQLEPFSNAVPETPLGALAARDSAGQVVLFAGSAEKLWQYNNATMDWDDVSQGGTTYGASTSERWQFAQFGNFVVAVNVNDSPQVFEIGTSTEFEDLGGSPPQARYVAVCGDVLMLGGLNGNPTRIHWSDINDIEEWTTGNSDTQDFPDGGEVRGMTNATNPIIFQRAAIRLGTFIPGSTVVFSFEKIHDKRGAAAPYSIAQRGSYTFFADAGGFFRIAPSGEIAPIGFEKVDRTVFDKIIGADLFNIIGEVDPFYSRVYWAMKFEGTGSTFDTLLIYDWNLDCWSQAGGDFEILFPLSSGTIGETLDSLDNISSSLDALETSLDSFIWKGGAPVMAAFDSDNVMGFFSGSPAEARIETQEMGDTTGAVMFVKNIVPLVDTNNVFVEIGSRYKRGDNFDWRAEAAPSANTGIIRKQNRARFHKFRMRIPAGESWSWVQGLDIKTMPMGLR